MNSQWVTCFASQSHQSCLIPRPTVCESAIASISLLGRVVSSIMPHCPMTNRLWVTLLHVFARQSHQSCPIPCPTAGEWHCFLGSLTNHVSLASYNREWVALFYFFTWQSLIPLPTGSEWHCLFLCQVVSSIMSHPMANSMWVTVATFQAVSSIIWSHDQKPVSDAALFLCQAVSSIISHSMTNRQWVTLLYSFARKSHQSCMSHPMVNSMWVTLLSRQSHQSCLIPWPVCEWQCLPGKFINHVSSHEQQHVSDTALFIC